MHNQLVMGCRRVLLAGLTVCVVSPLAAQELSSTVVASGGTITNYALNGTNYQAHIFTSGGTLNVSRGGTADCLVVGGGGGGARCGNSGSGGGGGGGVIYRENVALGASNITVIIGAGGAGRAGGSGTGTSGGSSAFGALSAAGGGYGGYLAGGGDGGSGGGGAQGYAGGTATTGQGNNGGASVNNTGGGGGGAGAVGTSAMAGVGGNGGAGLAFGISGVATYYGGGGGGASAVCGGGGSGGGGSASGFSTGGPGINGTGGGGGAGYNSQNGGSGGSGIVIVRYAIGGIAAQDQNVTAVEGTATAITLAATDAGGETLNYTIVTEPAHGTLAGLPPNVTYAPAPSYLGADAFTFQASNSKTNSNVATVSLTVVAKPNAPPAAPVAIAPTNDASGVDLAPDLAVSVSDPDSASLSAAFYGRAVGTTASSAPGPDFTLVALPDTQNYSASYPEIFVTQTEWIVSNRVGMKLAYVMHEGDIVSEYWSTNQWQNATNALYRLEDPVRTGLPDGIPWGACYGNHDIFEDSAFFNQYFGVSHFAGRSYYGGHYGSANDAHYDLFSAGGLDFIVLFIPFRKIATNNPTWLDQMAWANGVLQSNANRRAIVVSHSILDVTTRPTPSTFTTEGEPLFDALKGNTNLFLMLCGHRYGEGFRHEVLPDGRVIDILLADYQTYPKGGNGLLRLMTFSPSNNQIRVTTYSPWLKSYQVTADSQFNLDYTMTPAVTPAPFVALGANTGVASGAATSLVWPGLETNTTYEWYAVVSDGTNSVSGPVWQFTTRPAPRPNAAPVAASQVASTPEDTAVPLTLAATDADGDPLSFTIMAAPAHGTLSGAAPNVTYTPDLNYNGPDAFTFQAGDGKTNSNTATVTLTVTPVNTPTITAHPASATVTEGVAATFNVTASGAAPLSYQWYQNNAAIGGATASSYSTPATTTNDSGKPFKVTVSNAYGAATSSVATLTVNAAPTGGGGATYTVTYDANGATGGTAPAAQTKTNDVALILASNSGNLARDGFTFAGWNTAGNGSGTDYAEGASYTANAAVTLCAKWAADFTVHTVPYAEDFEAVDAWADNAFVNTLNGWVSDVDDRSTITNLVNGYASLPGGVSFPIMNYDHAADNRVVSLNTAGATLTTVLAGANFNADTNLFVDVMAAFCVSFDDGPAVVSNDVNVKASVYVNESSNLVVYCGGYDTAGGDFAPTTFVTTDTRIVPDTWCRVTILWEAVAGGTPAQAFKVLINGQAVWSSAAYADTWATDFLISAPSGGNWFLSAANRPDGGGSAYPNELREIGARGAGHIDDVVVTFGEPVFAGGFFMITQFVGDHGSADPAGTITVAAGGTTSIIYTADEWFRIAALTNDTTAAPAAAGARRYTNRLAAVMADHTVQVAFNAATASQVGIPSTVDPGWVRNYYSSEAAAAADGNLATDYLLGLDARGEYAIGFAIRSIRVNDAGITVAVQLMDGVKPLDTTIHGTLKVQGKTILSDPVWSDIGTATIINADFDAAGMCSIPFTDATWKFYKASIVP
jgi:hypothetical protein